MRILVGILGVLAVSGLAAAQELRCPASIELKKPEMAKEVAGWRPVVGLGRHDLANVTVYDGPIEENASLVPDGERKAGRMVQEFWKLGPKNPRGYWLRCHYAATPMTLARAVPKGATSCIVTADPGLKLEGRAAIESVVCK